jgi:hypothetical protein
LTVGMGQCSHNRRHDRGAACDAGREDLLLQNQHLFDGIVVHPSKQLILFLIGAAVLNLFVNFERMLALSLSSSEL